MTPKNTTKATLGGVASITARQRRILRWKREAWALLSELEKLDVEPAADVVRRLNPSPEVIASMAFWYEEWKTRARQGKRGSWSRRPDVTEASLLQFRDDFTQKHGRERGWLKAARIEFGISQKTLDRKLNRKV